VVIGKTAFDKVELKEKGKACGMAFFPFDDILLRFAKIARPTYGCRNFADRVKGRLSNLKKNALIIMARDGEWYKTSMV